MSEEHQELPIEQIRTAFLAACDAGHVVVTAPTGSGKSTRIPVWCTAGGRVLVVEPRRVACRSLARYVAASLGTDLGDRVGYTVRHDDRAGKGTEIAYVTPGVALRLFAGGGLAAYTTIVLDEFHERGIESDLFLAMVRRAAQCRLVVMSATIEGRRVAEHLPATHLEAAGRVFPVTIEYAEEQGIPTARDLDRRVAGAVKRALEQEGDILVFLPGKGEIADCAAQLGDRRDVEVIPLHGALSPRDQDRAFAPSGVRRIILATNVAETSVTLPRIRVVIDSGLVRRTELRRGFPTLSVLPVAEDSADQRAGRAGRVAPGRVVRLWGSQAILEKRTPPEILRRDLTDTALTAAVCGLRLEELAFLDSPQTGVVEVACAALHSMGALSVDGAITGRGGGMFRLPVSAWDARLLIEAVHRGGGGLLEDMIDLVAAVSQPHPIIRMSRQDAEPGGGSVHGETSCDATARIRAVRFAGAGSRGVNARVLEEARLCARQLRDVLKAGDQRQKHVDRLRLARVILAARPEAAFCARRRGTGFGNGHVEIFLSRGSIVDPAAQAIVAVDMQAIDSSGRRGRTKIQTSCAIPVTPAFLAAEGIGEPRIKRAALVAGQLKGELEIVHAGRVLATRKRELTGELARQAVAGLLQRRAILGEAVDRAVEEIEAWNASCRFAPAAARQPVDPQVWLLTRLRELGLERGEDLELITEADLRFTGLAEEERRELDRRFPRQLSFGDQICGVEYDTERRCVTLVKIGGTATDPPNPRYLPAWPGWRVVYRDRGRQRLVRE